MTDRELLELAAKAAGIESSIGLMPKDGISIIEPDGKKWNPLTDDGDALRLAVKLRITIGSTEKAGYADCDDDRRVFIRQPKVSADRDSFSDIEAVRRAIVRAAAAIGASQ